jgi:DNA-binding MarR family transcriptional regulator/GNAT superfamily N-acetyltransferase
MSDDPQFSSLIDASVERVRRFNRFYTRRLDLLDGDFLASDHSLGEVRILWELSRRSPLTAADLARDLGIDPGRMSRIMKRFVAEGWVARATAEGDARRLAVSMTEAGRAWFAPIEAEQKARVAASLDGLDDEALGRLTGAMADIRRLLAAPDEPMDVVLRPHRVGDLAEMVARQSRWYAVEHRFDERFEALLAEIAADFLRRFDPASDASFIAEVDGRMVGSVLVTRADATTAKLRVLHVETEMRGRGIGARLVDAALGFARDRGYRTMRLWTNAVLVEARRLYERRGFRRIDAEPHTMFGPPMVGETWERAL